MSDYDEQTVCGAEDVTIVTISQAAVDTLKSAIEIVGEPGHTASVKSRLRAALSEVEFMPTVARCSWDGTVTVYYAAGRWQWTCPMCRTFHEGEVEHD